MSKPFYCGIVMIFCASGAAWGQSTGTALSGDALVRSQFQQEMLKHKTDEQKAEAEFVKSLAGKSDAEKQSAIKEHARQKQASEKAFRDRMHAKKAEYRAKVHAERMAYMKSKLEKNSNLSATEKAELLSRMEAQYKSGVAYEDKQFTSSQELADKLGDATLTKEQRAQLLKEQAEKARAAAKAYKEGQQQADKSFRADLRAKRQAELKAAAAQKK